MPCFYLIPKPDDFNKIPELQVCIAGALYDAEAVLSNPSTFKAEEIRTLRDQITSNLERAWEITGGSADQLTGMMMQISQVVNVRFWPVVAFHQCNLLVRRTAASRRERSFKDDLPEQMNSFDEGRFLAESGRS